MVVSRPNDEGDIPDCGEDRKAILASYQHININVIKVLPNLPDPVDSVDFVSEDIVAAGVDAPVFEEDSAAARKTSWVGICITSSSR